MKTEFRSERKQNCLAKHWFLEIGLFNKCVKWTNPLYVGEYKEFFVYAIEWYMKAETPDEVWLEAVKVINDVGYAQHYLGSQYEESHHGIHISSGGQNDFANIVRSLVPVSCTGPSCLMDSKAACFPVCKWCLEGIVDDGT